MITVIARVQVDDFDTWHAEYDAMHAAREAAGERGRTLFRELGRPESVVVVFRWTDENDARAYFGSSVLQASLGRAHARTPELLLLEAVTAG